MGTSFKGRVREAVQHGDLLSCIEDIYTSFHKFARGGGQSGYWDRFLTNKALLGRDVRGTGPELRLHTRVRLTARHALNGRIGYVIQDPYPDSCRVAVQFSAKEKFKVNPESLELLPAATAVIIHGYQVFQGYAPPNVGLGLDIQGFDWKPPSPTRGQKGGGPGTFLKCPIPNCLGVPLVLIQLAPEVTHSGNEPMAVKLLCDPITGFAPMFVQLFGLGPVLVARSDGEDFTVAEMFRVYDYLQHLMDRWDDEDWDDEVRKAALTPSAFHDRQKDRQGAQEEWLLAWTVHPPERQQRRIDTGLESNPDSESRSDSE